MNLPGFSVGRPIFTSMVMLIIIVLGAASLYRLKVDLFPSIELPTVSVRVGYEGASPEVVEAQVTQLLEEIVATVPGVEEITSESSEGQSRLRVRFVWGTDIDTAALEVQAKLEDEINELPEEVIRPWVGKFDIESFPVVILGISSAMDPVEMTELIDRQIRYRFARIPGVAQVDLFGGFDREVRVELDRTRLEALGLPLNQILQALRDANLDRPSGQIEEGRYEVTLRAPAQFEDIGQIRDTVIATRDGDVITLGQIAEVFDTYERVSEIDRVNGERGIRVGIRKQPRANTVEVSQRILAEIQAVNRDYPQVNIVAVSNSGNFIERSIANLAQSVLYGGLLSILVLLFFLRDWRSTLVISLAIPISMMATFSLLYLNGFSLNLMSLGGLALGVGMMVDSSIVVLENIFRRHTELGEPPDVAASRGASEVATAIVASTLTTLVIFLPVIFIQGVSGQLFREMAYVVSFSLLCSLFVSLSLVPMLSAKLLAPGRLRSTNSVFARLSATAESGFRRLEDTYYALLQSALRHRHVTIWGTAVALVASLFLSPMIGTELMPPTDEGEVNIEGEMEVGTRIDLVDEIAREMEAIVVAAVPEMQANVVEVSSGQLEMDLSVGPARQRDRSNREIADDLRERLSGRFAGMEVRVEAREGQFLLNRLLGGGDSGIEIEVRGYELPVLEALAAQAVEAIRDIDGVADVDTSFDEGVPQQEIRVDRAKAADLGLSVRDVTDALQTAIAGSRAGEFRTEGNSYRILVQLADARQLTIDEVLDLTLRTPGGELVAWRNVVESRTGRAPTEIQRRDQQRLVSVNANVTGRPLGEVAKDISEALEAIPRPSGYLFRLAGTYEEQETAFREITMALGLALLLVFMVLACQYESLKDPLVVMISTPTAAIGVIVTLILTGTTLNLQSGIGCILLGGIVVNNAILLVDQASRLLQEGTSAEQAVLEAGRRRLRPILMTTLTTALGLMPLALGIGEGADAQAPLARAVVGGLLGSTAITLLLIPVIYSLVHRARQVRPAVPSGAAPRMAMILVAGALTWLPVQADALQPAIQLSRAEQSVKIEFIGTLWAAGSVDGPWLEVTNTESPYAVEESAGPRFYRAGTHGTNSIFSSRATVVLSLTGPLQAHFDLAFAGMPDGIFPPTREKPYFDGTLELPGVTLPVSIRVRGNSSLQECPFPKLKFKVSADDRAGTPFFDAREIKIGTHCAEGGRGNIGRLREQAAAFREVLGYEVMGMLDFVAPRVRRARVEYHDTTLPGQSENPVGWELEREALLLEDVEVVAERLGGRALSDTEISALEPGVFDEQLVTDLQLFHALMGNWDYSLGSDSRGVWNTEVIEVPRPEKNLLVPMAGDFDLASWVTGITRPSAPHDYHPELGEVERETRYVLEQVQQRVGPVRFEAARERFAGFRAVIESHLVSSTVDSEGRVNALRHVAAFFEALENSGGG